MYMYISEFLNRYCKYLFIKKVLKRYWTPRIVMYFRNIHSNRIEYYHMDIYFQNLGGLHRSAIGNSELQLS